jgi:hypothetical protein
MGAANLLPLLQNDQIPQYGDVGSARKLRKLGGLGDAALQTVQNDLFPLDPKQISTAPLGCIELPV